MMRPSARPACEHLCVPSCRAQLEKKVLQVLEARKTANSLTSGAQCQDIEALCEDDLERQQHASLPSLGRFTARYKRVHSPRFLSPHCAVILLVLGRTAAAPPG